VAFVAGIGWLHYIDESIYSRDKLITAESVLDAYNLFHTPELPQEMTTDQLLYRYKVVIMNEHFLWQKAKSKDRQSIKEEFFRVSEVLLNDRRFSGAQLNNAQQFLDGITWPEPKPSLINKLPLRCLRTEIKIWFMLLKLR
jgi:hypothetical protein